MKMDDEQANGPSMNTHVINKYRLSVKRDRRTGENVDAKVEMNKRSTMRRTESRFSMLRNMEKTSLAKFVRTWQRADEWHEAIWHFRWLRRCLKMGCVYVSAVSVVNGLYVALGSIKFIVSFPFMEPYFFLKELEIINGWIVLHTSFAFFMPQMVYLAICLVLAFEYSIFNEFLAKMSAHQLISELPVLRYRHAIITKMTDHADCMMRWYAFGIYSLNSPTLVITMYLLVRDWASMSAMSLFTFLSWVGMLVAQIAIISLPPAFINWQAHFPRSRLDQMSTSVGYFEHRVDVLQELSLFVAALTRREIGLSGGGFFVINKSFILTILSMILTYFSVLIQFDLGSGSCGCSCTNQLNVTAIQQNCEISFI